MGPIKRYLAEEVGIDYADGLIGRHEAPRRLVIAWFATHLA